MTWAEFETLGERLPKSLRYGAAVAIIGSAFAIRLLGSTVENGGHFLILYPAIGLCFFLFEAHVGIFALILSALLGYVSFVPTNLSLHPTPQSVGSSLIFLTTAGLLGLMMHRLHEQRQSGVRQEADKRRKEIKVSDRTLSLVADGAKIGIFQWDIATNEISISSVCCAHMGFHAGTRSVSYNDFVKRIHSGDRADTMKAFANAIETGEDFEIDYRVLRPDGTGIWLASLGRPVISRAGKIQGVESVLIDITNRKRLEKKLTLLNNELEEKVKQRTAELSRANEALNSITRHDALTGLFNRRAAEETLSLEHARMLRTGVPYAVLMLDIDFFKKVNDTFGHDVGDEVLKLTAISARNSLRVNDLIARFGGEEFLVLLPSTDLEQACNVAEKIRAAVEDSIHPTVGRVTVSIGVSVANPDQSNTSTAIKEADNQLYIAKEKGRNRVSARETNDSIA